jgi:hypothetical protein
MARSRRARRASDRVARTSSAGVLGRVCGSTAAARDRVMVLPERGEPGGFCGGPPCRDGARKRTCTSTIPTPTPPNGARTTADTPTCPSAASPWTTSRSPGNCPPSASTTATDAPTSAANSVSTSSCSPAYTPVCANSTPRDHDYFLAFNPSRRDPCSPRRRQRGPQGIEDMCLLGRWASREGPDAGRALRHRPTHRSVRARQAARR